MNGVLELLPHDMGLRVELDTNETYYLKSGWAERCDGIYGLACGYVDYVEGITWFKDPARIAIMNSHVKLAVPFDEHENRNHQAKRGREMSAAETDERTLPMTDTHYAVSIRRIYDAHTYMLEGVQADPLGSAGKARIAVAARDYLTGMLNPIPQQTLDDADALARIFKCKNYRNNETEMWK